MPGLYGKQQLRLMAKTEFDEDSGFIARHFKDGVYRPVYSFYFSDSFRNRRRRVSRWVAASVAAIALTATAVVVSYQLRTDNNAIEPAVVSLPGGAEVDRSDEIIRLEFKDAPLSEVVDGVEDAYGVTLTNVPEDDLRLTLSYEGTAQDFIETVNELLGTEIRIEK